MTEPAPLDALFGRAARLVRRRWALYTLATVVALALQAALFLVPHLNGVLALVVGDVFLFTPLAAIVFAFGASDCSDEPIGSVWGRIAERLWAVVFLEAASQVVGLWLPSAVGASPIAQTICLLGILILAAMIAFAPVHAIAAPDERPAGLLFDSLLASVRITTTRIGYARAIGLVFLPNLVVQLIGNIWIGSLAMSCLTVPLAALTVVFYLDCRALGAATAEK